MLWKTAKTINITQFLPHSQTQWSMTLRLAWIYTLSAFCILMVCALSLYWIFTSRLEQENYRFLVNNILILSKILETQATSTEHARREALREEVILEPAIYHYYVRMVDDTGQTFMETPGMSKLIPAAEFSTIVPERPGDYPTKYWMTFVKHDHKKNFLLINASVDKNTLAGKNWGIQIAMDISSEREIIIDYRRGLLIVLLLGVICSAGLGVIVTRRGLQPLRDMTYSAQQITIARLKDRLDPSSWPCELSALAMAFNNMLDRIEEGFTRLSQFSGDLAHELRTPITNLMGEAEIALSRQRSNDEYREVLESSTEELSRMSLMIENLLFLARAENPRAAVTFSTVNIENIMKDVCDFYEAAAEEKQVKLLYQGDAIVTADALMLRRAVSNLVANALKYSQPSSHIQLVTIKKDKQVSIAVVDEGPGIPSEHLPHIFDRFYRVDSARSQSTGGTGLGLAIVKFIMDLHKGHVIIDSEMGKGTVVTLLFKTA